MPFKKTSQQQQNYHNTKKMPGMNARQKKLAATYSRTSYTCTTIGKTMFDGRVRNGIGSDHRFMTTKKMLKNMIFENCTQNIQGHSLIGLDFMIKPHDRLVSVRFDNYLSCTPDLSTRWSAGGL